MLSKNSISDVAFLISPTGKIITWNAACQRTLGYHEEEVLLHSVTYLLAQSAKASCRRLLTTSQNDAEQLQLEIRLADKSHSLFCLTFVPQFRKYGKFNGYSVIISPSASMTERCVLPEPELIGKTPLRAMVNFLAGTFYVINQSGHFVMWNKRVEQATQLSEEEIQHIQVLDLFHSEEKEKISRKINEVFEHDGEVVVEANLIARNGTATPYLFSGSRFRTNNKFYLCGMGLDLSERYLQEEQLRLRERALHVSSNGIVIIRCTGKMNPIEYVNPAFERITGYQEREVLGRDSQFMSAPGLDDFERAQVKMALHERREINVVFRNFRKDGTLFWNDLTVTPVLNEKGVATHFIGVINDITATKHRTSHLEYEITHDLLTGLANRNLLLDRLEQALHVAQRNKTLVATVLIDLDNFKNINDSMGHDAGDELLKVVAKKLQASVRDSDTVARLGGDEFVLILYNQPSLRFTWRMIDRLRQNMAQAVMVDNKEIVVESSMGVSVFPHDGASAYELMRAADIAMYHAKAAGRNDVHFFSADMRSTSEAKHKLENNMRNAIEKKEMFLVFQPRVCLKTGKITAVEALLRWRHPEHGVLLPESFLPEAEENGLIIPFGEWVFDNVFITLQRLKLLGYDNLAISMNVSFKELSQKDYVKTLKTKLSQSKIPPDNFEIEIKESHLTGNPELIGEVIAGLSQLGIQLAIDEFGSGSFSLRCLQELPINHLKISRSLIQQIDNCSKEASMTKMMIGIGHNMHIAMIAEGVETSEQRDFLKLNDCDQLQGNYFSEPITLSALTQLLDKVQS